MPYPVLPLSEMVLAMLLIIGGFIWGIREQVVRLKLSRSGVKVDGRITDHRVLSGRGKSYILTYDYDYNGLTYSRRESVSSQLYNELTIGDTVSVICLPEHPKTARGGDNIPDSMVGPVVCILILIALMLCLLALPLWGIYNVLWWG